jgi:streptogramin lyase
MRTRTARFVSVLAAGALIATAGVLLSPAGASYGDVAQFDTGSLSNPVGIAAAGDGTFWYTDRGLNVVGHMQPDGSTTTFDLPTPNAGPWGVVVGPDGAIWFTERAAAAIGRLDPSTGDVREFPLAAGSMPQGITVAAGDLWVAERGAGKLARIDGHTGSVAAQIDVGAGSEPFWATTAPDGSVWFTERMAAKVGRYDPSSGTLDLFAVSSGSDPRGIAVAPNGTVWFTEWFSDNLGRLNPGTGTVTETAVPTADGNDHPAGVAVSNSGVWFVTEASAKILRYDAKVDTFDAFGLWAGGSPLAVAAASDGNLWVTEPTGSHIARVDGSIPDTMAPTITVAAPADGATYALGANVLADYSCADEVGGSGLAKCVGTVDPGSAIDTGSLGAKTFTVRAADAAGNAARVDVHYTVADVTAPTIAIASPVDGATYVAGQQVLADYACADETGGSGLASCAGDVAPGVAIDTAAAGTKTFTVKAADNAGNKSNATATYTVISNWTDDLTISPALATRPAGSSLHVSFGLGGDKGMNVLTAGSPAVRPVDCSTGQALGAPTPALSFGPRMQFQHGVYRFYWRTDKAWAGTCQDFMINLSVPGGGSGSVRVRFS